MKRKKYFLKRLIRAFMALFMSISIIFGSVVSSYSSVQATEVLPVVAKIAQYILSSVGAVNIATNGGVNRVSGNLYDGLVQKVSDAMGNGVYVDSSGNYVFSNEFTNDVLSFLNGQSSISYRVISDFNAPSDWNGVFENSGDLTPLFINRFSSCKSEFNYYYAFGCKYDSNPMINGRIQYRHAYSYIFYDMSNVAFMSFTTGGGVIKFYDKNFNIVSVPYVGFWCAYSTNTNQYYNSDSIVNGNSDHLGYFGNASLRYDNFTLEDSSENLSNFPFIIKSSSYYEAYSNRSCIISLNPSSGGSVYNKSSGTFISNYNIPTVNQNVVENNDWDSIYQNYVTNVSNSYTENNTTGNFDQTLLRKWMKNYSDNIITAIENGDTNIAEQINYLNEWMKKIYERLGMIYTLIENQNNVNSGGAVGIDSPWTEQNVSDLLSGLNRIDTNMAYSLEEMQAMNTLLTNVYNWLIAHPPNSGGGGGGTPNINDDPYAPWFDTLKNMPDTDRLDIISNWDIIKGMLADIAPFAMLGIVTASLNAFSAEPVEPVFTIPLKVNNTFINIDEEVVIDFTVLDDLRTIVNALMMILGTVCYAMFCWWIIPKLYSIIV